MVVSDALSRAYLKDRSSPELEESDLIHHVHSILDSLPISTARLTQLQKETASDPVLQQLKQFTLTGWPQRKQQIPPAVKPYYAIRTMPRSTTKGPTHYHPCLATPYNERNHPPGSQRNC